MRLPASSLALMGTANAGMHVDFDSRGKISDHLILR